MESGGLPTLSVMADSDVATLRRSLLEDAVNDVIGVYEAWWEANTRWPDRPCSERLRLAEQALLSALDEGLVTIEVGSWTDGTKPVDNDEARRLLRDWETWAIPEGPKVFFWCTEEGRRLVGASS
jgi:hypothetical protein